MKQSRVLAGLILLAIRPVARADDNPAALVEAKRINRELPSTWESHSLVGVPKQISHIKLVTPTHFTWVTYDRDRQAVLATAGGAWSFRDGHYVEFCDFASNSHQHLRGKTLTFTIDLVGDRWGIKGVPGSEIEVDDIWMRIAREGHQEKNTGEFGRQLLGTWENTRIPGARKATRMVKQITPTHWIWVIYDRENRMVAAAAGGTWSLRDGKYVEDCAFATENVRHLRGGASPLEIRIDGDRWIVKGGVDLASREDQTWMRLKKPNP